MLGNRAILGDTIYTLTDINTHIRKHKHTKTLALLYTQKTAF